MQLAPDQEAFPHLMLVCMAVSVAPPKALAVPVWMAKQTMMPATMGCTVACVKSTLSNPIPMADA
jgi:hypothetical protein